MWVGRSHSNKYPQCSVKAQPIIILDLFGVVAVADPVQRYICPSRLLIEIRFWPEGMAKSYGIIFNLTQIVRESDKMSGKMTFFVH
jgi:hypothetical protein